MALMCLASAFVSAQSIISVTSPTGGGLHPVGTTLHIAWACGDTAAPIQIGIRDSRYSEETGYGEETLVFSMSNTGSYDWRIPTTFGELSEGVLGGSTYSVVLYAYDGGEDSFAQSPPFSIRPAVATDTAMHLSFTPSRLTVCNTGSIDFAFTGSVADSSNIVINWTFSSYRLYGAPVVRSTGYSANITFSPRDIDAIPVGVQATMIDTLTGAHRDYSIAINIDSVYTQISGEIISPYFVSYSKTITVCPSDSLIINAGILEGTAFPRYWWNTGDTTHEFMIHSYGPHTIIMTDGFGCQAKDSIYVKLDTTCSGVGVSVDVHFWKSRDTVCANEYISFGDRTLSESAHHVRYQYDFSPSCFTGRYWDNPVPPSSMGFNIPGTFWVKLTAFDTVTGRTGCDSQKITVLRSPVLTMVTADTMAINCLTGSVTLRATTDMTSSSTEWFSINESHSLWISHWGDSLVTIHPEFNVAVAVDTNGCLSPYVMTYVLPCTDSVTHAHVFHSPDSVCTFEEVYLTNATTSIHRGRLRYTWTSDASARFLIGDNTDPTIVFFSTPGVHTIRLTVYDSVNSRTSVDSTQVYVNPTPIVTSGLTGTIPMGCGDSVTITVTTNHPCYVVWNIRGVIDTGTSITVHDTGRYIPSYLTDSHGCSSSFPCCGGGILVTESANHIYGDGIICRGSSGRVTDPVTGGTWTSSNTAIATIGSTTGLVNGVATGSAVITYTVFGGCIATKTISIVTTLPSLTGPYSTVCVGQTITLFSALSGGAWSSSAPTIATVGTATGVVTGVAGNLHATITYTSGACFTTKSVSVNPLSPIVGPSTLCQGTSATYTDATAGGIWTSTDTTGATIGSTSGIATGLSAGTIVIVYTLPTGCGSFRFVTVNAYAPITGAPSVCNGQIITLANAISGGVWSSSAPTIATVGTATGVVTGMAGNLSANITYTFSSGCRATYGVTVNALSPISAPTSVCQGTPATLTDATSGGTWSSGDRAVATIGSTTGLLTGLSGGTATIAYNLPNGCVTISRPNINPIATITGTNRVCLGKTTSLSASLSGGTWSSGSPTIATIGSTGIVTGIAGGLTSNISYTMSTGCRATMMMSVTALPSAGTITGASGVATGASITLTDATSGGTWSSSNTARATVGSTGVVTGVSSGAVTITYTVTNTGGCSNIATKNVSVGTAPPHGITNEIEAVSTAIEIKIMPNPNNGEFTLQGRISTSTDEIPLEIYDLLGRILFSSVVKIHDGNISERIQLSSAVPNGTYLLVLHSAETKSAIRFVKE